MKRVLFVGEDVTLAHVTRPLVLADSLDPGRYETCFASGRRYLHLLEKKERPFHQIPTLSSEVFLDRLAKGKPVYTKGELEESVKADLELLKKIEPDLVVGDFRLSLGISARLAGIPYVNLTNGHWSPYSTLPFPVPEHPAVRVLGVGVVGLFFSTFRSLIFKYHARPFNLIRKEHGLSPLKDLRDVYTGGDWTLYLDLPLLAPTSGLPDNHLYLGPVLWAPDIPVPTWWGALPEDRPILYVTMGSSGEIRVMSAVLEALKDMPMTALVASADRFDGLQSSRNIFVAKYLPGLEAAKRASLVLCSGGTATTYQALSFGTPVLGVPSNADQYLSMEAIVRQGAGRLIRAGKIKKRRVREGIRIILNDGGYRKAASRLREEMSRYDSKSRFSSFIDSL